MPTVSKTIKKYALGHYFVASFFPLISSKFFGLYDNSGLVYTPRRPHLVFTYNLNLFRPKRKISESKRSLRFRS